MAPHFPRKLFVTFDHPDSPKEDSIFLANDTLDGAFDSSDECKVAIYRLVEIGRISVEVKLTDVTKVEEK